MLLPKDAVLKTYPCAIPLKAHAVAQSGSDVPGLPAVWYILSNDGNAADVLGEGDTEELAWEQAARSIE